MSVYTLEFSTNQFTGTIKVPHDFFLNHPDAGAWFLDNQLGSYKGENLRLDGQNSDIIDSLVDLECFVVFSAEGEIKLPITHETRTVIKKLIDRVYRLSVVNGKLETSRNISNISEFDYNTLMLIGFLELNNKANIMKHILGCDKDYVNKKGNSLLVLAHNEGMLDIVKLMILAGFTLYQKRIVKTNLCDIKWLNLCNSEGYDNSLSLYVSLGDRYMVKKMLANGANPNQVNIFGETPLFVAIRTKESFDIFHDLIDAGADINFKNSKGCTPLEAAKKCIVLFQDLVDAGCKCDSEYLGTTGVSKSKAKDSNPLIDAIMCNNQKMVDELIRQKYGLQLKGGNGETPLTIAIKRRRTFTVNKLVVAGYDLHTGNAVGDTPLIIATRMYWNDLVEALLKKRCDKDKTNNKGESYGSIILKRKIRPLA